ncbi:MULTISPECIES: TRAP transporter substrate-binding protein [Halomonas]|uniref:TRAP transporter substrate-binding protein n=1 Tax=Halomonas TaxID=2745 RepID=UPI001A8EA4C8|nr:MULTISPECIES: TRAP transporter substrate-binding protein [Halomonas]MBN8411250.1 TRAP transporter substrate-binding protein [Halomonas litopenaei]MBY5925872.1 TRAP transporter substrate-binding protein [Halomonas sp. DP4Y7-2]MBY5927604.1 TRAP transporter substrate-binding protein [Halomonas sp. DP8Y7-3]MBY5969693.1 TRAP transporter substrate-binding protein [Halomonas denitrificans]MBY5985374.1 TRAP transporter substrate-binding protein [Halomonas sp. DP5Y7-2]
MSSARHATNAAILAAVTASVGLVATPAMAEQWRGWNIHPPEYPNSIALETFAKQVDDKTDGRITPKVYHNAVLGDQPDAIEQTRNGALDFGNFNMGPMGPMVPAANVLSLPFIFESEEAMYELMDGEIGDRFAAAMEEQGLIAIGWFGAGSRSLYNTDHPVQTPDDVKGMKVRVMNNDLYVEMIDALGGNATPMAYGEVYQSLTTGVIDGAENNFPSYESSGHYEVARYYSLTNHLVIPECLCVARSSWEQLSADDQAAIREAAAIATSEQRELWAQRTEASRQKALDAGVEINEVPDKTAFQTLMEPVYDGFLSDNPDLASLVDDIRAAQAD